MRLTLQTIHWNLIPKLQLGDLRSEMRQMDPPDVNSVGTV